MFPENILPPESIPMPYAYAITLAAAHMPEYDTAYHPERFRRLSQASHWLPAFHSPMLSLISNLDQTPYLAAGYELGLMPCYSNPNEMPSGCLFFNPTLTECVVNDGARRQGCLIRLGGVKHDASDCFVLGKTQIRIGVVRVSQKLASLPPPNRAENECPICRDDMAAAPRFTCPNGHQTHQTCWDEWKVSPPIRDKHLCVICRCDTTQVPKKHLRTEFHMPTTSHRNADLLALSVFKFALGLGAGSLLGTAVGDTLFRFKTEHHLTEWRAGSEDEPVKRGVIISTRIQHPYWRDFLTFFRSAENIDYLLSLNVKVLDFQYGEGQFLADLNANNPVEEAMRMLTEAVREDKRDALKWRTIVAVQIITKTDEEILGFVKQAMSSVKNNPPPRYPMVEYLLPAVPPVVAEPPVGEMPMVPA
jgi:hypothetical protein